MISKCIFFDLDGTLTDSGPGIMNCARATFLEFGVPVPDDTAMRTIIGPPLKDSFARFGIESGKLNDAVAFYRSIYTVTGKYENDPYPGIQVLLEKLNAEGHRLFVATSKPEHMAVDILEHFGMAHFFERICGADTDHVRSTKSAVIAYLLGKIGGAENAVMVGDTVFDVEGAAEHGIPTVCVDWGYGIREDMLAAGAKAVVNTMEELYSCLSE